MEFYSDKTTAGEPSIGDENQKKLFEIIENFVNKLQESELYVT